MTGKPSKTLFLLQFDIPARHARLRCVEESGSESLWPYVLVYIVACIVFGLCVQVMVGWPK